MRNLGLLILMSGLMLGMGYSVSPKGKTTKFYINGKCYQGWGTHTEDDAFEAVDDMRVGESRVYTKHPVKYLIIEECEGGD